ncbi:MAG: metallophosphoesterase [Campylobacterales bacterium]|nr:metallophosphoesterase [Campylobacterales bacterium]
MNTQHLTPIQEGALFIADSHYPHYGETIIDLLSSLPLHTPQLFLMGDIFDILFDHAPFLVEYNQKLIDTINKLSQSVEIFYFEGNHDFNLQALFPRVKVYSIDQQPQIFSLGVQSVALAHGDKYEMGLGYQIYTQLIRTPSVRNAIPFQSKIIKKQIDALKSKKICKSFDGFETQVDRILKHYQSDWVIEGHYHQGKKYQHYISLPSLVCQKSIAVVQNEAIVFKSLRG